MLNGQSNVAQNANTPANAVVPFFIFGGLSFITASVISFFSANKLLSHYLNPEIISLTHIMALGWVTMIIFGAILQLLPVFIESQIYSIKLAYIVFGISIIAIPMLVFSFYRFDMGKSSIIAAILMITAFVIFLINIAISILNSKTENIHAIYIFTSAIWLMVTGISGLLQVVNFSTVLLENNSFYYLPFHAISGICGWFLLLVIGISSRLIPMFLISKYTNTKLLWAIYILINLGIVTFIFIFLHNYQNYLYYIPIILIFISIILFIFYCYNAFKQRIRKTVESQLKVSLFSVSSIIIPLILILIIIGLTGFDKMQIKIFSIFGFFVFFVTLSVLILGMTFKTLPFIIWNKIYGKISGKFPTPSPKDLYSNFLFNIMIITNGIAVLLFISGIIFSEVLVAKSGAAIMFVSALLYNLNLFKIIFHKPSFHEHNNK